MQIESWLTFVKHILCFGVDLCGENLIASMEGRMNETVACEVLFIKTYSFGFVIKTGGWGGENGSSPCFNPDRYWVRICVLRTFLKRVPFCLRTWVFLCQTRLLTVVSRSDDGRSEAMLTCVSSRLWLPTDTAMKGNIILGSSWVLSITTESSGTTQKNFKWGLEAAIRVIEVTLPYYLDFISSCVEEEVAWSPRRAWKCCQPWMWELFQSRAPWAWDLHFLG